MYRLIDDSFIFCKPEGLLGICVHSCHFRAKMSVTKYECTIPERSNHKETKHKKYALRGRRQDLPAYNMETAKNVFMD
jgi:hypothetical protein